MVSSIYESLLQEIGAQLNLPQLHPDENHSCEIKFPNGLEVQIEMDATHENLMVATRLGNLSNGRYRQEMFLQALKANGLPPPRHGTLAFNPENETLVLFSLFPTKNLNGARVAQALSPFMEQAVLWRDAIISNDIPTIALPASASGPFGLMGLRP